MKWILWIGGGLIGVIVLACVVLLALGQRANAGRLSASADITAPPGQVWQWVEDPAKLKRWISWLVEVRTPNGSATGVGAKRVLVMKDENNGGELMEIGGVYTRYQPPTEMDLAISTPGTFEGTQTYRLTDLGNGRTRFQVVGQYHFSMWLAKLFEPLITPAAQKKLDGDVSRLKSLAEAEASTAR